MKLYHGSLFQELFNQSPTDSPEIMLATVMWAYWANVLIEVDSDRSAVYERMKRSFEQFPVLREPQVPEEFLEFARTPKQFMQVLEETLKPIDDTLTGIEAEVASLHEVCAPGFYAYMLPQDPRYTSVLLSSFDSVPALINHLDDTRLTRSGYPGQMKQPPRIRTVGELAGEILCAIAARKLPYEQRSGPYLHVDKEAAAAWWKEALKVGEKPYLLDRLGKLDDNPNPDTFKIVAHKYPEVLFDHCMELLEAGKAVDYKLFEIFAESSLPDEQKATVLRKGAASEDQEVRWSALRQLHAYDEETFVTVLVETLDSFGDRATGPAWDSIESRYTHVVLLTKRQEAWDALLRAAKRAEPRLRMQYMNPMNYTYVADRVREQRLRFLANFVFDEAVRVRAGIGPEAAFQWDRIRVGDFATMKLGSILGIEPDPEPEWREEQWTEYCPKVLAALKEAGIEAPKPD